MDTSRASGRCPHAVHNHGNDLESVQESNLHYILFWEYQLSCRQNARGAQPRSTARTPVGACVAKHVLLFELRAPYCTAGTPTNPPGPAVVAAHALKQPRQLVWNA